MSQEPHPKTKPGSTPAQAPAGAAVELERQRAEGEMPGRPTRDPLADRDDRDEEDDEDTDRDPAPYTDPTETASTQREGDDEDAPGRHADRDRRSDDPMRSSPSTGGAHGVPQGD